MDVYGREPIYIVVCSMVVEPDLPACLSPNNSYYLVDFVRFSWDGKPYTSNIKWRSTIVINGYNNRNHKKGAIFY